MYVRLVGITEPKLAGPMSEANAEEFVAYCARVSSSNQDNPDTTKLLSYMVRNKHWSPFEMVNVVMEIKTTRDIARQILRHRSFSFQEFSQRYAEVDTNNWKPREARLQDHKNRQNSRELDLDDAGMRALQSNWESSQREVWLTALDEYNWAIKNGIAKEVARSVLPEGLTMSRMYMNGTLRSWIHYCDLRCGNGTQKEHREVAEACKKILIEEFPFLNTYWSDNHEA